MVSERNCDVSAVPFISLHGENDEESEQKDMVKLELPDWLIWYTGLFQATLDRLEVV